MLSNDPSWLQQKNRRLLLELIVILNQLKVKFPNNLDLSNKILYIKASEIYNLEQVFLSPEGRQWIYFVYSELKNSGKPNPLIMEYAGWLGINQSEAISYLVQKLDEFVLALLILSKKSVQEKITLKFRIGFVLPGLNFFSKISTERFFSLESGEVIEIIYYPEGIKVVFSPKSVTSNELIFEKLEGSSAYSFCIDSVSEVSRINIRGREHLPRVSNENKELILKQIQVIEKALAYIKVFDDSIERYFKEIQNSFVPLQAPEGALPSSSNSSIDTMFWYSVTDEPLLMAEMIIHEYSHQRLFRLQDTDPLLNPAIHGSGWEKCEIYSPWRDDPRPINGVFHGFIVFTEASRFWMALIKKGGLNQVELEISKRRMAMLVLQLNHARESLRQCKFTPQGEIVFSFYGDVLTEELIPYVNEHRLADLRPFFMEHHDEELPSGSSILEVVNKHETQWRKRNDQSN